MFLGLAGRIKSCSEHRDRPGELGVAGSAGRGTAEAAGRQEQLPHPREAPHTRRLLECRDGDGDGSWSISGSTWLLLVWMGAGAHQHFGNFRVA